MSMNLFNELQYIQDKIYRESNLNLEVIELGEINKKIKINAYKMVNDPNYKYIVIVGCPHGNEPIGGWYCTYLLRQIVFYNQPFLDSIEANLFIIPILDMGIVEKNKEWINSNFNYLEFFKNNYLNPVYDQLEFSYSLSDENDCKILKRLHQELNKIDNKIILTCHQTPSIYGGYYYTNVTSYKIHRELQSVYISKGIPLEIMPQGCGVKTHVAGVFGQFNKENLGEYHYKFNPKECSQTYFSNVLNCSYLTMEIPFGYSSFLYNKQLIDIKPFLPLISEIMINNDELLNLLDNKYKVNNLSLIEAKDIFRRNSGYYWLKAFIDSDKFIRDLMEKQEKNIVRLHDFCCIVRLLFYKGQFVGMLTKTEGQEISKKVSEVLSLIVKFMDEVLGFMDVKWVEPKLGIQLIHQCVQILIKNRDEFYGNT